jgi:cysteine-rich repeat protein
MSNERCGNGEVDDNGPGALVQEECDDTNSLPAPPLDTANCNQDCSLRRCGDGYTNRALTSAGGPVEACDDGNKDDGDGCNADCTSTEICGNGLVDNKRGGESAENCEPITLSPGQPANTELCDSDCTTPSCGDRHHNPEFVNPNTLLAEECDTAGDTENCDSDCTRPRCGDGHLNKLHDDEECDNGDANDDSEPGACRTNCKRSSCGDGVRDSGEVCDDGNARTDDGCPSGARGSCQPARCGDGFIRNDDNNSEDEACDFESPLPGQGCSGGRLCSRQCRCEDPPPPPTT